MADSLLKPLGLEISDLTDSFSMEMREVKKLVEEGKMSAAEQFLLRESPYFSKRLADTKKPLPIELEQLANHVWQRDHAQRYLQTRQGLERITDVSRKELWPEQAQALNAAGVLASLLETDATARLLRLGSREKAALRAEIARVERLAEASRSQALASTFDDVMATGKQAHTYVGTPFSPHDYTSSEAFQAKARALFAQQHDRPAHLELASRLESFLSPDTKAEVDRQFALLFQREILADGRVTLEEMASIAGLETPFGSSADALAGAVKLGYVDLTSASFKDRNIFDFEIAFKKDLALTFEQADESVLQSADWGGYDYLFVTDLAVAKVSREFRSRNPMKSRAKTGERQDPNPDYVTAMSAYQQAMAQYQREQFNAALPRACSGWGCVLQGLASGIAQSAAKNRVDEAANQLARTSQTLRTPVYAEYSYQSVDIETRKAADVGYYVIDVKGGRILSSSFQVSDQEQFNVAYNVRDEDPDKTSILRNTTSEEEVTAWEKRPIEVPLSALFSPENLTAAPATPLTDVQTFLASLTSRTAVAAAPVYARGAGSGLQQMSGLRDSATTTAQTIADERFDSIVIMQGPNSIGTGFYVTPELVLTAHHVVDKSALVQMTFYDGTKTFGRVVAHDIRLDLALVRAQTTGKPLKIHQGPLRLGETVEAIGHPKGYEFTITRGVISAVRKQRSATIGSNALVEFVQTDTPISPGNSGGPLLLHDVVIGVNDWIRVDKGAQNLNFSVSYNEIRSFLDRFKGQ